MRAITRDANGQKKLVTFPDTGFLVPLMVGGTIPVMSAILPNTDILAKNGWYWLRLDRAFGSIGRASSNAQIKSDLLEYLFLEWGGSQVNWDGGADLPIPDYRGRVIAVSGQGAGLSPREPGDIAGEENHLQTSDEVGSHSHTYWHRNSYVGGVANGSWRALYENGANGNTYDNVGGQPFNVVQPTVYEPSLCFLGVQV